ncbi:MAG: hypothetical protein GX040_08965 [Alcaligenaceae bacterium]|mgnify:CR=1 FL=1|nr:hypothetical protein [Alcaligenaceae bacterium]
MANVSLSNKEFRKALSFVSVTTVLIGGVVGAIRHFVFGTDSTLAYAQGFNVGISMAVVIAIWVFRRPWTITWLAQVTGRPIIHGVWFGHLDTNYNTDVTSSITKIPIAFVIKQTYLGYSLLSYTAHQNSETLIESLVVDDQHGTVLLRYMYEFSIRKPDERKLTTGAAELRLVENCTKLTGHYLTNSPTQGFAELVLVQRDCQGIDTFSAVQKLYNEKISAILNNR